MASWRRGAGVSGSDSAKLTIDGERVAEKGQTCAHPCKPRPFVCEVRQNTLELQVMGAVDVNIDERSCYPHNFQ